MEIKIDVNEEQFKTLMEKTIADLPQEKLQEVVLEGMKGYLSNMSNWPNIFFDKDWLAKFGAESVVLC